MGSVGNNNTIKTVEPITMNDGLIEVSNELKNTIFNVTGTDRVDVLNKVATALNTDIGIHGVFTGSSKHINFGNYVIDVSTKKKKGEQIVTDFAVWQKDDKKTVKMFYNK